MNVVLWLRNYLKFQFLNLFIGDIILICIYKADKNKFRVTELKKKIYLCNMNVIVGIHIIHIVVLHLYNIAI